MDPVPPHMADADIEAALAEQINYYRVAADEYDAANRALAHNAGSSKVAATYRRDFQSAVAAVRKLSEGRDVLEIAGGTGMYTEHIAQCARTVTVIDTSPESLALNSARTATAPAEAHYVLDSIFSWCPPRRYEVVIFAFWLCHVPLQRFDAFWAKVQQALASGGEVLMIDAEAENGEQCRHDLPELFPESRTTPELALRTLRDGRQFQIVRVLWERNTLTDRLTALGWEISLDPDSSWLIGCARRRSHSTGSRS